MFRAECDTTQLLRRIIHSFKLVKSGQTDLHVQQIFKTFNFRRVGTIRRLPEWGDRRSGHSPRHRRAQKPARHDLRVLAELPKAGVDVGPLEDEQVKKM